MLSHKTSVIQLNTKKKRKVKKINSTFHCIVLKLPPEDYIFTRY